MSKPVDVVSLICINGVWVNQDDLPPDKLRKIIEKKMDTAMGVIGFKRKTA